MTVRFTHLHTHTPKGSLLDGFMNIEEAVKVAKSFGMDSLGVSDHGTMASHPEFNTICKKNGIKPVFGMEAYITPNKTFQKKDFDGLIYDILVDEEGEPILNKKGIEQHIFKIIKKEEFHKYSDDYTDILTITPQTQSKKLISEAKPVIQEKAFELLEEEYPRLSRQLGETRPLSELKKKEQKVYIDIIREQIFLHYIIGIKGDASIRNYYQWFPRISHLLLIAMNDEGYHNLIQLNNIAQLEGFYVKPRIDYEDIKKYGKGIVATTACLGGTVPQLILKGKEEEAKAEIRLYQECFDRLYLEIQPSEQEEQKIVNTKLIEWSKELNLPLIATSDVHMVYSEDLKIHKEIVNINRGNKKNEEEKSNEDKDISVYDSCYFMHPDEFLHRGIPEIALTNAYDLAHKTNVTVLDENDWRYPITEIPEGDDFDSYLEKLSRKGLFQRFLNDTTNQMNWEEYNERLNFELKVIKEKKIAAYFIIVWDFLNYCHRHDILTGPGRGSAAGSLVAFSLEITNIDPIRWQLLFERFLNPERPGFPDVDSDVDGSRKAEVIDYLANKYGQDKVAQIGTYMTMATKGILKDMGRILEIPHEEINTLNKIIPNGATLEDALELPEVQKFKAHHEDLFELAERTVGTPKSSSIHACGLVISPSSLLDGIPLMRGKGNELVTQYEGPELESIGFIKFDLLGLSNLNLIEGARKLVEERHGIKVDMKSDIFFEDEKMFQLIKKGDTLGLFQIESEGMQQVFKGLNKVDFESIIAGVALYRPGPMANIPSYQRRANGYEEFEYLSPEFELFTKDTFGILVYQEQVMRLVQEMAGYTKGESDMFRKAIGKKKLEVLMPALDELGERLRARKYSEDIISQIRAEIEPFAGYGFNRSHAAAYAVVACQTAYFKAHYPIEFYASLLSVNANKKDKIKVYIEDARAHGFTILPPDINRSKDVYVIEDEKTLRMGFGSVNGLGGAVIPEIMKSQPYEDLAHFALVGGKECVKKQNIETLALSGCFDSFYPEGTTRMSILGDAFLSKGDAMNANASYNLEKTLKKVDYLEYEKTYLGFYFSGHPLDGIGKDIDLDTPDEETIRGKAILTSLREIITKKGDYMAFVDLSFINETIPGVIFPRIYNESIVFQKQERPLRELLQTGLILDIAGKFKYDFVRESRSFIVDKVGVPIRINQDFFNKQ